MGFFPSSEQVTVSWLKGVPGLDPSKVATTLPGDPAVWSASGFVQVPTVLGGSPPVDTPLYAPVVQVDCWANNPNSQQPPWGKAASLAGAIEWATYRLGVQRVVVMGGGFNNARVLSVYPVSPPRRVPDDEAGFARYSLDLVVRWVVAEVAA